MRRPSIQSAIAFLAMLLCAGLAQGQLTITTPSLPAWDVNVPNYSQTLQVTGGTAPYMWSGVPPDGLQLLASGVVTGTPTGQTGTLSFQVTVTDSTTPTPLTANGTISITINAQPTITTSPTLQGDAGSYSSSPLGVSGGTSPFTFTVTAGALPTGTSITQSTGAISGTATAGTYTFTITVTDAVGGSGSQSYTVTIAPLPAVSSPSPPQGEATAPYDLPSGYQFAATGGTPPYTWAITSGSLPSGLSLSLGGVISGTLAANATTQTFSVQVTDSLRVSSAAQSVTLTVVSPPSFTTASVLPQGEVGIAYSTSIIASGGSSSGYKFAVSSGTPPAGLTLSNSGTLSGTPTTPVASDNFTVTVTDSAGGTASQAFALTIVGAPTITTTSPLLQGEVTVPYSQTLTASGGSGSGYKFTVTSGTPPGGLTLTTAGVLSGTPTTAATAVPFTVTVTDGAGGTGSQAFTLTVIAAPTITTASPLNQGEVNATYSQTLTASGGTNTGFTWSLATGSSLPAGLILSAGGVISGTPTVSGPFAFTIQVADSAGGTATKAFTLTIIAGPTITTAPVLPNGTVGAAYTSVTLTATGGTPGYTWSISAGALPAGLSFNGTATTASISGTPTASGTFNFTVQVSDARSVTGTKPFTITIASGLTIVTAPSLPPGIIGQAYTLTLTAAGGTSPYTWATTNGTLPPGMTLAGNGHFSGTPTSAGTFNFTVQVTDSNSVQATQAFNVTISSTLAITSSRALPSGIAGTAYTQALIAAGGIPPYSWTITAGSLPTGLMFSSNGVITGTPVAAGSFSFTASVTDSTGHSVSQQFTLSITSGLAITSPTQLPNGSVNSRYSQTLAATGGTPPYAWSLSSGKLPPGLALSPAGVVSGTPNTNGSFSFTVQVADATGTTASLQVSITISSGLAITSPDTLPSGTPGQAYTPLQLAASGGRQPYTWVITSGVIASGLALSTTGTVSGTPTSTGTYTFTVQVTDANGATATLAFTISILPPALPEVTISGIPQTATSDQQIPFSLSLASAYPLAITGTVTLTFSPNAVNPADDPAIVLSTGGTTTNFSIAANSTNAVFSVPQIALQTGTVSGSIVLTFTLEAGGVALPATGLTRTITIAPAAPTISAVQIVTGSNSFQVEVTGFSSPRDLTEADLTFTPASGQSLQTTSAIIDLTAVSNQWFGTSASAPYGSQFILVMPFTATQGSINAVGSVSVTLKNATGASASTSANF